MTNQLQPLMTNWLLTVKKAQVLQRTFERLMSLSKLHVFPNLGEKAIDEINSHILQHFLSEKLPFATAKKCNSLLNDFFKYCYASSLISVNPIENVSLQENKKPKHKGIAKEDRQAFIDAVSSHRFWKPFCLTIMFTGIKIGELLPLKWRDIDFDKKNLTVKNAMAANIEFDDSGNVLKRKHYISPTFSLKEIPLSDKAVALLLEYKSYREREQRRQKEYSYLDATDLVFGNEKNELRSYSGISHLLDRFLNSKGLRDLNITFSTIKHTFEDLSREERNEIKRQQKIERQAAANAAQNLKKNIAITKYKKAKAELEM